MTPHPTGKAPINIPQGLLEGAQGEINLYAVWDRENERAEWKVFGKHAQEDFLGFRLLAQVENLSDIDFWQEFDRSFDANTRRDLFSFAFLTRSFGPYSPGPGACSG